MEQNFIVNIFVVGFVILTLGFIMIKSWILALQTFSTQKTIKSGKPPSPSKTLIEYIIFALGITLLVIGILYIIHNHTDINLRKRVT